MATLNLRVGENLFKIKAPDGKNNLSGSKIAELRQARGYSQRALAKQMQLSGYDVDHYFIRRVENGERFLTDIDLKIFCEALQVTSDEILDF